MYTKNRFLFALLFIGLLMLTAACGTPASANSAASTNYTSTPATTPTATPSSSAPAPTQATNPLPTATPTHPTPASQNPTPASPTPTPAPQQPKWKTYSSSFFTIQYPAGWVATIIQQGPSGGIYAQQVEFRPSTTSPISFMVSVLYNGEMLPDTMLHADPLYKSCKIDSEHKVVVNAISWSTAIGETQGTQLAPAKVQIAYANHLHPYRISFSTPPSQFTSKVGTLDKMFDSFREKAL